MYRKMIYLIFVVLALGLTTTVADADITDGLVGYWPLDEGEGTTTADLSGNENHGTFIGNPAWDSGKLDAALNFDGTDDAVDCGNSPILDFGTGDWTVSAWIKATAVPGDVTIFGKGGDHTSATLPGVRYQLMLDSSDYIHPVLDDDSTKYDPTGNIKVIDGQWHQIVMMRRDGTKFRVYIDGVEDMGVTNHGESTITATYDLSGTSKFNAYIGAITDAENSTPSTVVLEKLFPGLIDDVAVWNRALTADEVIYLWNNGDGNPVAVPEPGKASDPSPADETTDVPRDVTLSWIPGEFANTHDVYLGTTFADVNDAGRANPLGVLASQGQSASTYAPASFLDFGRTYFWRVDEVNAPPANTIFKGEVWSFTVEPFAYPIAGENITATASSSNAVNEGPENTINGSGLDADDLHSASNTDMWLSSTTGPQPTWIQYEFDSVYKLHEMLVWNHNSSLELAIGFGIKQAAIEYSTDGASWTTLGTFELARATGLAGYAANTTVELGGIAAKYVKLTANSNWGGILPQYGLSEVRFFYVPVVAREPDPASGTTDTGVANVTLSWRAGREAASHDVYLSTDQQAVIDETVGPVSVPAGNSYASSDTGELNLAQTYYWKVNEVNIAETPAGWQGDVWDFATREFLVVDDIEDYNDSEGFEVFSTWMDGYDEPANGSQVGHDISPFAEQTIVHGGKQSMPFRYDNSAVSSSEATANVANLKAGQNWTKHGIKALTLYFYGEPNNIVAEQMYVKLNGSKVVYGGDASALKQGMWKRWRIDLASFGVNLGNVTQLSIGLERTGAVGGKGVVYFDDIGLYSVVPEPLDEVFLEAEAADVLGASWRVTDDTSALGGKHIGSNDGDGNDNDTAPGAEWTAIYNFTASGGVYKVVLRGQEAGSDSFWVRITTATSQTHEHPGQPGTGWVKFNGMDAPSGWAWDEVHSDDHGQEVVLFTLPAGANTLEIAKREDGVLLDALVIVAQ